MRTKAVSIIDGSELSLGVILVTTDSSGGVISIDNFIASQESSHEQIQKLDIWRFIGISKRYNFTLESVPSESRPWLDKTLSDYSAANEHIDWWIGEKNKSDDSISVVFASSDNDRPYDYTFSPEFGYENAVSILHELIVSSDICSTGDWQFIFQITEEQLLTISGRKNYIISNDIQSFQAMHQLLKSHSSSSRFFVGQEEIFAKLQSESLNQESQYESLKLIDSDRILSPRCSKIYRHHNSMISILVSAISNQIFPRYMIPIPKVGYRAGFYPVISSRNYSSSFRLMLSIYINCILTKGYKWLILFLCISLLLLCFHAASTHKHLSNTRMILQNHENLIIESKNQIQSLLEKDFIFENVDQIISFFKDHKSNSIDLSSLNKVLSITKKFPPHQIIYQDKSMTIMYNSMPSEAKRRFSELKDPIACNINNNSNNVKLMFK